MLQKKHDSTRPAIPTIIRMEPAVFRLIPLAEAVTAHLRIAPTAMTIRLAVTPILPPCRNFVEVEVFIAQPQIVRTKEHMILDLTTMIALR